MKIGGLQKLTLLDYPGYTACTVFLAGCDFRCPYCHNFELAEGTVPAAMEEEELLAFLYRRRGLLDGVAISGGEPCLSPGLASLLARIRERGFRIKLDTNGAHPDRLRELLSDGLVDMVAMDIKNSPGKYAKTCGVDYVDIGRIRESIGILISDAPDCEFRTTVVKEYHEASDFEEIGALIRGAKRYFLQPFEDRDSVVTRGLHPPLPNELRQYAEIVRAFVPDTRIRGTDLADETP